MARGFFDCGDLAGTTFPYSGGMPYWSLLSAGLLVFASTDLDDYLLLVVMLADRRLSPRQVLVGQYLGFAALLAVGMAGSCLAIVIPARWLGLLGVWPLLIGVQRWLARDKGAAIAAAAHAASTKNTLAVMLVTMANGGDNITAYVPFFAGQTPGQKMLITGEFLILIGLWYLAARYLVNHPVMGNVVRRVAVAILPYVLMGLGVWILARLLPGLAPGCACRIGAAANVAPGFQSAAQRVLDVGGQQAIERIGLMAG